MNAFDLRRHPDDDDPEQAAYHCGSLSRGCAVGHRRWCDCRCFVCSSSYQPDLLPLSEQSEEYVSNLKKSQTSMGMRRHCDDYIDDPAVPQVLRTYLARARSPAHGMMSEEPYPKLFATYKGERHRVVMASTMGDVGITQQLDADFGYSVRVAIEDLADFSDVP